MKARSRNRQTAPTMMVLLFQALPSSFAVDWLTGSLSGRGAILVLGCGRVGSTDGFRLYLFVGECGYE